MVKPVRVKKMAMDENPKARLRKDLGGGDNWAVPGL